MAPRLVSADESSSKSGCFCKNCLVPAQSRHHTRYVDLDTGVPWPGLSTTPLSPLNRLVVQKKIMYALHIKLRTSSGVAASEALRSHTFSVAHDATTTARSIFNGINADCTRAFSIVFVGSGNHFHVLKSAGFSVAAVGPPRTLQVLTYLKEAGHPCCRDIQLPPLQEASEALQTLQAKANEAAVCEDATVPRLLEERMENPGNAESLLCVPPQQSTGNAESIEAVEVALSSAPPLEVKEMLRVVSAEGIQTRCRRMWRGNSTTSTLTYMKSWAACSHSRGLSESGFVFLRCSSAKPAQKMATGLYRSL